jgi:hypothetical protein
MAGLHDIYQRLGRLSDPSVDAAVVAALPSADPESLRLATHFLLERGRPDGLIGIVLEFHRLPDDLQMLVVNQASELYRPLREAAGRRTSHGPANVVRIVARARAVKLAYLVGDQLRHNSSDIRHEAAACLLELSRWAAGEGEARPNCDTESAQFIVTAVDEAVAGFDRHLQPALLEAFALLLPRAMPKAMAVLDRPTHPAIPPMRRLLARPQSPTFARILLPLLRPRSLHDTVLAGLEHAAGAGYFDAILAMGHLVRLPQVAALLQRIKQVDALAPRPESVASLRPRTTRALPDWFMALPLEPHERLTHLARLVQCRDAMTRLITLRRLIELSTSVAADAANVNQVISVCCGDAEPRIAVLALRHLIRVRWPGLTQVMFKLINSPQAQFRELSKTFLAPLGFDRLWQAWPRLPASQRVAAGRALAKIDPDFDRQLHHRLVSRQRAERMQALAMVSALARGSGHLKTLVAMVQDADDVIASSAVRALGTAPDPEAQAALERALDHRDTRVRANAVEALQQIQSADHVRKLMSMAVNDEARPRANAIAALLHMRTSDAMTALVGMLNDPRPQQRVSALWLVDHLGLIEVARHIAEMSITDPDAKVQQRARTVVEHLIQSIAQPAPELELPAHTSLKPAAAAAPGADGTGD